MTVTVKSVVIPVPPPFSTPQPFGSGMQIANNASTIIATLAPMQKNLEAENVCKNPGLPIECIVSAREQYCLDVAVRSRAESPHFRLNWAHC